MGRDKSRTHTMAERFDRGVEDARRRRYTAPVSSRSVTPEPMPPPEQTAVTRLSACLAPSLTGELPRLAGESRVPYMTGLAQTKVPYGSPTSAPSGFLTMPPPLHISTNYGRPIGTPVPLGHVPMNAMPDSAISKKIAQEIGLQRASGMGSRG